MRYHEQFLHLLEAEEVNDPRSLQRQIGPSEIGEPCIHCLGCKLAELPKDETRPPGEPTYAWARIKGKVLHNHMEHVMERQNLKLGTRQWLIEHRVTVGTIGPKIITGSADLFDIVNGVVIDWKMVSNKTLLKVQKGVIAPTYDTQRHLYGKGFEDAGYEVKKTLIMFMPVEKNDLKWAIPVYADYSRSKAESALQRANDIWELIQTRGGPEVVIPKLKRLEGCWNCERYPL